MKILLDTSVLMFAVSRPGLLSAKARQDISNGRNDVFFSTVSIWEVAIKASLGNPDFANWPEAVLRMARETGFDELRVSSDVACHVADLPPHHGDPFDRLLVVQAMQEPAYLYTTDRILTRYSQLVTLAR